MIDTKSPLQSLTVNSLAIGLFVQVLGLCGVQIAPETAAQIGESINSIITAAMILVAIYGRIRAKKVIAIGPAEVASPALCAVAAGLLAMLMLAGCDTVRPATAATLPPAASAPLAAALDPARAVALAEAASAGVDVATERAIADGVLTGAQAVKAREAADGVRSAMLIARGVAGLFGAETATDRLAAVLLLAAAAQEALPLFIQPGH